MGWLADFLIANKFWLQVGALIAVILGTSLQFVLSRVDVREAQQAQQETRKSYQEVLSRLEVLQNREGTRLYLEDLRVEALKKHLKGRQLTELESLLADFSQAFQRKDVEALNKTISAVLKIIPTDPFFRVFKYVANDRNLNLIFSGELKTVQVIRWDWLVEGDEKTELRLHTFDEAGNPLTLGPFTNNAMSVLNAPLGKSVKIEVRSTGTGRFEYYPRSFRIGWAVLHKQKDGSWQPLENYAEYDPFFRVGLGGYVES